MIKALLTSCCWYHKGTNFQANHNNRVKKYRLEVVVADTTKVRIFKQITTYHLIPSRMRMLLLIPQRYEFSSKSQLKNGFKEVEKSCCWYHKGTNFQANHNIKGVSCIRLRLLLIPQRYEFSSKSQQAYFDKYAPTSCCWYHKGTNFQANHNIALNIMTHVMLLLIPQRYEFSSKSQQSLGPALVKAGCCWYHKGTNFQANHNLDFSHNLAQTVVADTTKVRIFKQITTILWCIW